MFRTCFLLLPVLALQAQDSAIPGATEVRPGVFVLRGTPNEQVCAALKQQRITHVVDLRRDGEPNLDCQSEAARLMEAGIQYMRYAINRTPPPNDFDFLRSFLRTLPRGSRVLLHCNDGNHAAAVVCTWLVMDKAMPLEEAMALSKSAGLHNAQTEESVRQYLQREGRG